MKVVLGRFETGRRMEEREEEVIDREKVRGTVRVIARKESMVDGFMEGL